MRVVLAALASVLIAAGIATATTVIPPTFESLVAEADDVFEGQVIDVRSQVVQAGPSQLITTAVSFRVSKTHKGSPGATTVLEFLGGTVGTTKLVVEGMPQFAPGDRDILFVNRRDGAMSPLVGFHYGRFRIVSQGGGSAAQVAGHDGRPLSLRRTAVGPSTELSVPMSVVDFESAIAGEVARQGARGRR